MRIQRVKNNYKESEAIVCTAQVIQLKLEYFVQKY